MHGHNHGVQVPTPNLTGEAGQRSTEVFSAGVLVILSLSSPREKYWGVLLELSSAGVSLSAVGLDSFDDFTSQIRAGERVDPAVLFFPMHRVERIELDARCGEVPSMAERFEVKSGRKVGDVFRRRGA